MPIIKELHPIFQDNAKTFLTPNGTSSRSALSRAVYIPTLSSPYDCVLFTGKFFIHLLIPLSIIYFLIAWKIWRVPRYLSNLLVGLRSFVSVYVDSFVRKYIKDKLSNTLQPERISLIINLLHGMKCNFPI